MIKQISEQPYPIYFGEIYDKLNSFLTEAKPYFSRIFILVDENTHTHCLTPLISNVEALISAEILEIDAGEESKNIEIVHNLWQALAESNVDRQSLIINLGGGVISDLGGFMASVYKRGIRFINIPTSLLAMVDAAIGGKTGIDLGALKNQIGCFSNPEAVFVDPSFLDTLPLEQLKSGFGELLKYSLISDANLWEGFKEIDIKNSNQLGDLILSSIEIKHQIVEQDPKESGLRKVLNFGHTYGHAFESLSLIQQADKPLLHGEAVAFGIICELWHSVNQLKFSKQLFDEIVQFINQKFGSFKIHESQIDTLIDLMRKDKKNSGTDISVILLEDIGKPKFDVFIEEKEIRECLSFYIKH